ncbi:hypothetical protein GLOIN_2v1792321 [Rhizophagus clarus]|uniref:Uncharacterized protein n=1 Tax=Rhizophagus clarus TaxID=94130 RepID=A0A8H3LY21_9GLOM|nr:hypothetical protein GLOIN_2v1792321 [Rhizophagus clarus]
MQILLAEKYWSVYHMHCLYAGFGKGKVKDYEYYRPRIHKSQMAICFDYWKLLKITDDNECSKAKTEDGSAQLIQRAYRNYRKRSVSLEKQVWEAVRNDNTPREKKFLSMPSRDIYCTVNLNLWYSIDGLYRPFNVPLDQFYDYISYLKHKRRQLSNRLAIARNKI